MTIFHFQSYVDSIQEFWGYEGIDMSMFTLSNYKIVNQNKRLSTHGGLFFM